MASRFPRALSLVSLLTCSAGIAQTPAPPPSLTPAPVLMPPLPIQAIPREPDLDLSGNYIGRLRGYNNQTALLDLSVRVSGFEVTATVTSRADKQTYQVRGTRSIFRASPVMVNLLGEAGTGSPCEGGFTERLVVNLTFVRASEWTGEGGRGSVQHFVCDPLARQFRPDPALSGELEVARL